MFYDTQSALIVEGRFHFEVFSLAFVVIGQRQDGFGASFQDKADDCIPSFGRSGPDFTYPSGSEFTSSVKDVVNGLNGWTDDLYLGTVFAAIPHAFPPQRALRAALWQVIVPLPSELFMSAMLRLQQRLISLHRSLV